MRHSPRVRGLGDRSARGGQDGGGAIRFQASGSGASTCRRGAIPIAGRVITCCLEYLLEEAKSLHRDMAELDGVHLVLDTERLGSGEITDRIRSARPDKLSGGPTP